MNNCKRTQGSTIAMRMRDSAASDISLYCDYNVATNQYWDGLLLLDISGDQKVWEVY